MLSFECIKWSIQGVQYPWSCQFNIPRNCFPILICENSSKDVGQSQLECETRGIKGLTAKSPTASQMALAAAGSRVNTCLSSQLWWIQMAAAAESQHLSLFTEMMDSGFARCSFGFADCFRLRRCVEISRISTAGNPVDRWQETRTRHKRKCHDNGR